MTFSDTFKAAVFAQETDEVFIALVTIDHDDLAAPIRVTSDGVATESRGETYVAYPFDLQLPDDSDEPAITALITIDNVDREILATLRQLTSRATVTMEIVLASDPDTVEQSFPDFELGSVPWDALTITGELTQESFLNEPYPAGVFAPAWFRGLF